MHAEDLGAGVGLPWSSPESPNSRPHVQTPASTPDRQSAPNSSPRRVDTPPAPVLYDGTDESCSICQAEFQHGERVCRLACRHMFHRECWERYMSTPPLDFAEPTTARSCPNCRGAGTVIAEWTYIRTEADTQIVNGQPVPNDLDHGADFQSTAPENPTPPQTPPTPHSTRSSTHQFYPVDVRPTDSSPERSGRPSYPIATRLADGRPSIIIDPGSVGNLCGDKWAQEVARLAHQNGHSPSYEKRSRPLEVSGVGNGSQECHFDCTLPVAIRPTDSSEASVGSLQVPAVSGSELPGLLGLNALRKNRAVLDFTTLRLYFCGPNDYELERGLPEGSDTFQLEIAPSGHIVLPCCEYQDAKDASQHTLTLLSRPSARSGNASRDSRSQPARGRNGDSSSSCNSGIPPPPVAPPVLPVTHGRRDHALIPPERSA